jgi:hypothetical protein
MLKNLFISKVRVKVLEYFFLHPNEENHVRGLVRVLDEEINAIRRELLNLEDAGLLKTEKKGNKIEYRLNHTCPIYEELRGLILKESEFGKRIQKIAKDSGKLETILLSNSYFTGDYSDKSDLDFLFIGNLDIRKLGTNMKEFEAETKREYRYTAITMQDLDFGKKKRSPFVVNVIETDFVVLYGSLKRLMM